MTLYEQGGRCLNKVEAGLETTFAHLSVHFGLIVEVDRDAERDGDMMSAGAWIVGGRIGPSPRIIALKVDLRSQKSTYRKWKVLIDDI